MASTTAIPRAHGARTPKARSKKPAGFHQSWYAIARSAEVGAGEVIGRDFLDGRAIVYRGENGDAVVMNAYCRHLGADLSMGKVVGNDIRCAFHHWQYGPDGGCTKIPASEKIPKAARMFKFPTAEKWGLIWAFNGTTPLFDVPVTIAPDERPLGTHIFTAQVDKDDANVLHWSVVSLPAPTRHADRRSDDERSSRKRKTAGAGPVEMKPLPVPDSPAEALDRLSLPADIMARISEALSTGGSIIVSDQGITAGETGEGTDFIVSLR